MTKFFAMKLRISEQSIRYRLTAEEVLQLRHTGLVSQSTFVGPVQCQYAILADDGFRNPDFNLDKNHFHVTLPKKRVIAWADDPAAISLRIRLKYPDYPDLLLLIEKDLECKHEDTPPGEDATNLFPHEEVAGEAAPPD